jgi:hypothetical protein
MWGSSQFERSQQKSESCLSPFIGHPQHIQDFLLDIAPMISDTP